MFIILIVFIEPMTLRVTLCCLEFKGYSAYMGTGKTVATSINILFLFTCATCFVNFYGKSFSVLLCQHKEPFCNPV